MSKTKSIFLTLLAVIVSVLAAFFVVFNAIFSDVFNFSEHLAIFPYVLFVYALLSFLFSLGAPEYGRRWVHIFSWPALMIVILYSLSEYGPRIVLHLTYAAMAMNGAVYGSWIGVSARLRRQPQHPAGIWFRTHGRTLAFSLTGLMILGVILSSQLPI